ncbi:hypothetical protein CHGG_08037 [Chaetomium globosum CBS 148.51]|uniref:Uncharacterized protein n=1 Tax=Chaetomium globosum (strain ATCC 6205 / CBS 148.51 / DSM 1962 / NBRC 6347 / NRRL 1970) TaxID=306901 RepID=Q2GVG7_CHAGB|nr:uncharacterized protein CHGG_08037 [Chaetomium globosum CBS 148.51]EAQ86784.1 hypothetical protein CHGG_08037 [Chaetomium globosum CBS 148.51]
MPSSKPPFSSDTLPDQPPPSYETAIAPPTTTTNRETTQTFSPRQSSSSTSTTSSSSQHERAPLQSSAYAATTADGYRAAAPMTAAADQAKKKGYGWEMDAELLESLEKHPGTPATALDSHSIEGNNGVNLANPGGGTSPVKPEGSARFLGVWLDWKLNWKAHLVAVEKKAENPELFPCIRSALAYGASSFHILTDVGGEPAKKGITKALGKAQNKSLRIVAGAFKSTPIRNLETETWVPPLNLYLNKRLADFENRLQQPDLDDGQGGKKTAASVVLTACRRIQQRLSSRRGNRGRPRTLGPQGPTAVERAAGTVMRWTGGIVDTNTVVEKAWKARWLKERDRRAITRPADDFDHQQETLFRNKTLRRHDGLSKAKSSLLIQIRTGAIGLRDFLFPRGVPEVLTPACECGEGRETAEHLVVWCLAPPLTRRWERIGVRTRRDFYSVLHGINPTTARLVRRVLDWLMDSGKLPMYNLARRLELEAAA